MEEGHVSVNSDACIACGACFDACIHGARDYYDDTERFFDDLKKGEEISLVLAPAFVANYRNQYQKILGYLKEKGVKQKLIDITDLCELLMKDIATINDFIVVYKESNNKLVT